MRSHVILSMIKVAAAEADVPDLPPSGSPRGQKVTSCLIVFNCVLVSILSKWWYSAVTRTGRTLWRNARSWCYHIYYYCWLNCPEHFKICFRKTMKTTLKILKNKHQLNIECSLFQIKKSVLSQLLKNKTARAMLAVKNTSHRQEFSAKMNKKQLFITVGTTSTFLRLIQIWKMMTASNPARSQKLFIKVKKTQNTSFRTPSFSGIFLIKFKKYCTFLSKLQWTGNRIRTLEPLVFESFKSYLPRATTFYLRNTYSWFVWPAGFNRHTKSRQKVLEIA